MNSEFEVHQEILEEREEYEPVPRKQVKEVQHKTEIGRIVWTAYKPATPLVYARATELQSEMLKDGYQFWAFENKLRKTLEYCSAKKKPPIYAIGAINNLISEIKEKRDKMDK